MKVLRKAKENLFILFIAAAYIAMFIIDQNMGIASVKNSFYYIKEMIMIMPVIFVLTALLDLWVPKEKIMKYLPFPKERHDLRSCLSFGVLLLSKEHKSIL